MAQNRYSKPFIRLCNIVRGGALKLQVLENASRPVENRSTKDKMCKGEKHKYGKNKYE